MRGLTETEKRAQIAVKKLREETLESGSPFMIYDKNLPKGKYYLEYPDGRMDIVTISRKLNDYVVEEILKPIQADLIRNQLNAQFV
ncbi:hypothetical protein [Chitinophaga sp. S165]|uniref:hypothetical protein n=1 Tax=Chitinophaga sp. S165 TaxID=2135462 RepID=UPI000D709336|nr:hypothetical protein [Chitinophaga sp. S165]PWV49821.1 hypothetical protein C7475_105329 [Chitinophaga sp. S165]